MTRRRRGITLVETMVALAVAGVILVAGRLLIETTGETSERLAAMARQHAERALLDATIRAIVEDLDAGSREAAFVGTSLACRFRTRCIVAGGWREPCTATLQVLPDSGGFRVALSTTAGIRATFVRGISEAALLYLESVRDGGVWRQEWQGTRTAPLAIGIVMPRDTVILRIGVRG